MKNSMDTRTKEYTLNEIELLFDISQALDRSLDLREVVQPVLDALAAHIGMVHGTLMLLNRNTREISICQAYGMSETQRRKGRYRLGEGITGKVVETGKPAIIPRISEEPRFLDRTGTLSAHKLKDMSYVCVPIRLGGDVIGALSIATPVEDRETLNQRLRLLTIIASMVAQAVKLRQSVQEERWRLSSWMGNRQNTASRRLPQPRRVCPPPGHGSAHGVSQRQSGGRTSARRAGVLGS